jgi:hypothetical protein
VKYEFHLLFLMVAIGLLTKRLSWRGWLAVMLLVFGWIMYCWKYQ